MKLEPNDFVEHPYDFAVKVFLEIIGCMDELVVPGQQVSGDVGEMESKYSILTD